MSETLTIHLHLGIYAAHAVFWLAFLAGDLAARRLGQRRSTPAAETSEAASGESLRAPNASLLVGVHMIAFAAMYAGIGSAVFGRSLPPGRPLARSIAALVIVAGGVLVCWARISFASWRFRAQLDAGHQLATGGPFRVLRHPIYAALDLLAVGTLIWIPTPLVAVGAVLMAIGGDLRARAEEPLLERAFGGAYREYRQRTWRFVPGVY